MNAAQIAKTLYERGISTPGEYKAAKGNPTHDISRTHGVWCNSTVLRILEDERYIGTYVIGKKAVTEVGSSHSRTKDKSKWFILPDHHPAIVEKQTFDQAQSHIGRFSLPNKKQHDYPLKGKAFCGCCDHALSRVMQKTPYYHCRHSEADSTFSCHGMKIGITELEQLVFEVLKKQVEVTLGTDGSGLASLDAGVSQQAEYDRQMTSLQDRKRQLYEQYLLREIDLDTYKAQKADCDTALTKTKNAYAALAAQAKQAQEKQSEQIQRKQMIREISEADCLTSSLVNLLIDKVYVFPEKRIEIKYKISDFNA